MSEASSIHPDSSGSVLYRSRSSSTRSEKFIRSFSIPLNINTSTTPPSTPTIMKRSFINSRSNSVPGIITSSDTNGELSIGKRIRKRLSKNSNQLPVSTRSRSNSIRKSLESSSTNSPIFNNASFSDITEDYFKYDKKKRNKSNASSTDSYLLSLGGGDPLDTSSQTGDEYEASVYSSMSFNNDITLSQIIQKNDLTLDDDDDDDDNDDQAEIAESMAFDILQKIKEISLVEENEDAYSI